LLCRSLIVSPFVLFLLTIMLSVPLRFTDSDYLFDIFKLFLATTLLTRMKLPIEYPTAP